MELRYPKAFIPFPIQHFHRWRMNLSPLGQGVKEIQVKTSNIQNNNKGLFISLNRWNRQWSLMKFKSLSSFLFYFMGIRVFTKVSWAKAMWIFSVVVQMTGNQYVFRLHEISANINNCSSRCDSKWVSLLWTLFFLRGN